MRMHAHAAYKIAVDYFLVVKIIRVFYFCGLQQPQKYFDNENFQIYGIIVVHVVKHQSVLKLNNHSTIYAEGRRAWE